MKFEIQSINYCLPLTEKQWDNLGKIRDNWLNEETTAYNIFTIVEKIGVYNLNWDGHFGRNLFFNIEHKDKNKTIKNFKLWIKTNLG